MAAVLACHGGVRGVLWAHRDSQYSGARRGSGALGSS